ncbi:ensconsin-like [Malaclemys terrapin pileata]|uniref:ensconsin-like n=1 Tax=Malaclemys terrapin pileata TaxID=2991368 RepID=UPI0023A8CCAA|nr:ensconsin-like [Malaclemys terrapin pileata]
MPGGDGTRRERPPEPIRSQRSETKGSVYSRLLAVGGVERRETQHSLEVPIDTETEDLSGGFSGERLRRWPWSQRGAAASIPRQRAAPPSPWHGKQLLATPGDGPARPCSPGGNQLPGLVPSGERRHPGRDGGGPSSVWAGRTQPTGGTRQGSSGFASAGRPALSPAAWASRRHPQGRSWGIAAPAAQLVPEGRAAAPCNTEAECSSTAEIPTDQSEKKDLAPEEKAEEDEDWATEGEEEEEDLETEEEEKKQEEEVLTTEKEEEVEDLAIKEGEDMTTEEEEDLDTVEKEEEENLSAEEEEEEEKVLQKRKKRRRRRTCLQKRKKRRRRICQQKRRRRRSSP